MAKALSLDLRERILAAYDGGGLTQRQVAERFLVSVESVKKLLRQRRQTGEIGDGYYRCGAKPKITAAHREKLQQLLDEHPDLTLEQLREGLGLDCTVQAIHYVLKNMGISYKKRHSELANKTARTLPQPENFGVKSKAV